MSAENHRGICKRIAIAIEVHGLTEGGGTGTPPNVVAGDTRTLIDVLLAAWELSELTEAPVAHRRAAKDEFRERLRELAGVMLGPTGERVTDLMAPRTWHGRRGAKGP